MKYATIVLAGGSGSRLGSSSPKGCFPVTLIKKKSLYQLLAERVVAASKREGCLLHIAFMTSPETHQQTIDFFERHHLFGLDPSQLHFFVQGVLPLEDFDGNIISEAACGNGDLFQCFVKSPVYTLWKQKQIEAVSVIPVDNALADPFDAKFFHFHKNEKNDVSLKVGKKRDQNEKAGVVLQRGNKTQVIEYTDLEEEHREIDLINLGMYIFEFSFLEKASTYPLALHLAKKMHGGKAVIKKEKFIFDILPFASKSSYFVCARKQQFAPLKNSHGEDSIEGVQAQLLHLDREVMRTISGYDLSSRKFELAMDFHYPTGELLQFWKGKKLPENVDYVEGDI